MPPASRGTPVLVELTEKTVRSAKDIRLTLSRLRLSTAELDSESQLAGIRTWMEVLDVRSRYRCFSMLELLLTCCVTDI